MHIFRVNEAARELGCSEAFLRRAEKGGRIPTAKRDLNSWRVYTEEDIARLRELLMPTVEPKNAMHQKAGSALRRHNVQE